MLQSRATLRSHEAYVKNRRASMMAYTRPQRRLVYGETRGKREFMANRRGTAKLESTISMSPFEMLTITSDIVNLLKQKPKVRMKTAGETEKRERVQKLVRETRRARGMNGPKVYFFRGISMPTCSSGVFLPITAISMLSIIDLDKEKIAVKTMA